MIRVFLRAFAIVTLTALNVSQVSRSHYQAAFFTGGILSFVWWANTRTANQVDGRSAQIAYATGAGFGTVFGMFLGHIIGG